MCWAHHKCVDDRGQRVGHTISDMPVRRIDAMRGRASAEFKTSGSHPAQPARVEELQGYLAHKKRHPPLGPPYVPRHSPKVGS